MAPSLSQCSQCTDTVYPIDVLPQEPTTTSSNPFVNYNLRPSSSFCQTFQDTVNVMRCGLRPPTDSVIGDPSIQTIKAESPNFAWNGSHFPSPASQTDGSSYDSEHAVWASPFREEPRNESNGFLQLRESPLRFGWTTPDLRVRSPYSLPVAKTRSITDIVQIRIRVHLAVCFHYSNPVRGRHLGPV